MTDFNLYSGPFTLVESFPSGQSRIQETFSLAGNWVLADDSTALSYEQRRAVRHIGSCRTAESGFNLELCDNCGYQRLRYNSCGDRNCPICQGLKKEIYHNHIHADSFFIPENVDSFYRKGADGTQSRTFSLTPEEFVRRFLLHVLPQDFQKIRYYGYLNNCSKKDNLTLIFNLQGFRQFLQKYKDMTNAEIIYQVWGHDIATCPRCHVHAMTSLYRSRARPVSSIA